MRRIQITIVMIAGLWLAGCETTQDDYARSQAAMSQTIAAEAPGNYFVGRRFFRRSYFFWGYIRRPQQPWSTAKLVMLNEQKTLAPDRHSNAIGSDNNFEYHLQGYFSGQTVYEPASNSFYPEFVLTGYKVVSERPPGIFRDSNATNPDRYYIDKPQ